MKSYWISTEGEATRLELREVPVPSPGPGEVRLRIRASSLNRGEFIAGHGLHGKAGGARPAGFEAAGEIDRLGSGVAWLKVGNRVMGRCVGAFAEFGLMDAREAIPVPQRLTWEEAGGVPVAFMTVHDALIAQGRLIAGEWLLIAGVAAGVGVAALQVGKALGAKVIGTSGSAEKIERLKGLGLDAGIGTRAAAFCDDVMQATDGQGANLVVNNVGGSVFAECLRALAYEGRFATVGYVDGVVRSDIDLEALHAKRLRLFGVSHKLRSAAQRAETVRGLIDDILPMLADGRIRPVIDGAFDFSELQAAKTRMESNAHIGKIVVRMD
jgi:NADPH:quinone reductase